MLGILVGATASALGACNPTGDCSPANCSGCCDSAGSCTALTAQSIQACGGNGQACRVCAASDSCDFGVCKPFGGGGGGGGGDGGQDGGMTDGGTTDGGTTDGGTTDGGTMGGGDGGMTDGGSCAATQCPLPGGGCGATCTTGCCDASGACVTGSANSACGRGSASAAVFCQDCASVGATCDGTNRTCVVAAVGSPCSIATDCASLGAGAICKQNVGGDPSRPYVGGYCTLPCSTTCPGGSTCFAFADSGNFAGETQNICLADCSSGCRDDYFCLPLNSTQAGCWTHLLPGTNQVGSACSADATCLNPATAGWCRKETNSSGFATGFTDGYCMADCGVAGRPSPDDDCAPGDLCVDLGSFQTCLKGCVPLSVTPGNGCRTGYKCAVLSSTRGACYPDCHQFGCNSGYSCRQSTEPMAGYCCASGSNTDCY